jgi:RNA polymerase nonessential primary-like sigma factor
MNCDEIELQRYIKDASRYPLLTPLREKELSEIIQKNPDKNACLAARNELINGNLLLVIDIATKMYSRLGFLDHTDLSIMDLIQFGNCALIRCAEGFKNESNAKFNSYSYAAIEREMYRRINEHKSIHFPLYHEVLFTKIRDLETKYGESLTDKIIMDELKISAKMLKIVRSSHQVKFTSMEHWEDFLDHFEDKNQKYLTQDLEEKELKEFLLKKMKELNPQESKTIYLMFFDEADVSMASVARKMGITRERVRMVMRKALKKLKIKIIQEEAQRALGMNKKVKERNRRKGKREERKIKKANRLIVLKRLRKFRRNLKKSRVRGKI